MLNMNRNNWTNLEFLELKSVNKHIIEVQGYNNPTMYDYYIYDVN